MAIFFPSVYVSLEVFCEPPGHVPKETLQVVLDEELDSHDLVAGVVTDVGEQEGFVLQNTYLYIFCHFETKRIQI